MVVEFMVSLMDIEDDACRSVLRKHVQRAMERELPFITSEVTCAEV